MLNIPWLPRVDVAHKSPPHNTTARPISPFSLVPITSWGKTPPHSTVNSRLSSVSSHCFQTYLAKRKAVIWTKSTKLPLELHRSGASNLQLCLLDSEFQPLLTIPQQGSSRETTRSHAEFWDCWQLLCRNQTKFILSSRYSQSSNRPEARRSKWTISRWTPTKDLCCHHYWEALSKIKLLTGGYRWHLWRSLL